MSLKSIHNRCSASSAATASSRASSASASRVPSSRAFSAAALAAAALEILRAGTLSSGGDADWAAPDECGVAGAFAAEDFVVAFSGVAFFAAVLLAAGFLAAALLTVAFLAAGFWAAAGLLAGFFFAGVADGMAPRPADRPEDVRDADASGSGAGVRLVIRPLQSVNRDMSVDLSGGERSVPQQLLNGAQISAALEQVRGCGVPQAVRTEIGCVLDRCQVLMHQGTNRTLVDATPPPSEKQGRTAIGHYQRGSGSRPPRVQRLLCRRAKGHGPFLRPFAEDPYRASVIVHIVHIEPAQFADSDAGGIEQLQDRDVSGRHRVVVALRAGRRPVQQVGHLSGTQDLGQRPVGLRTRQPSGDIAPRPPTGVPPSV